MVNKSDKHEYWLGHDTMESLVTCPAARSHEDCLASGWRPLPKGSKLPTKLTPWEPSMERGACAHLGNCATTTTKVRRPFASKGARSQI